MKKMVLAIVMALTLSSSALGDEQPSRKGFVYTVYPVRSCVCSVTHFVKDTAAGVAEGAVTVMTELLELLVLHFELNGRSPLNADCFINRQRFTTNQQKFTRLFHLTLLLS